MVSLYFSGYGCTKTKQLSSIVGFWDVLQQNPFETKFDPPRSISLPSHKALNVVISDTEDVCIVGISGIRIVVKFLTIPYEIPFLFIAYALTLYFTPSSKSVILTTNISSPLSSFMTLSDIVGFESLL